MNRLATTLAQLDVRTVRETARVSESQFVNFPSVSARAAEAVNRLVRHGRNVPAGHSSACHTASNCRTPSFSMSAPAPRRTISPRSITRY